MKKMITEDDREIEESNNPDRVKPILDSSEIVQIELPSGLNVRLGSNRYDVKTLSGIAIKIIGEFNSSKKDMRYAG